MASTQPQLNLLQALNDIGIVDQATLTQFCAHVFSNMLTRDQIGLRSKLQIEKSLSTAEQQKLKGVEDKLAVLASKL